MRVRLFRLDPLDRLGHLRRIVAWPYKLAWAHRITAAAGTNFVSPNANPFILLT